MERAASGGPAGPRTTWARAEDVVKWAAVLLGCSIPVSVAADNVLLAFILLCWIVGGRYREKLAAIRRNPVALATLALFAMYLAGTLCSTRLGSSGCSHSTPSR
jgi:hypothetical protein